MKNIKDLKIVTLGQNSFIAKHLNYETTNLRLPVNSAKIRGILQEVDPDVVINCIAFCGKKNIDDCEIEKERTLEANLTIPTILATECNKLGIQMLHIGSGCIAYGASPNASKPYGLYDSGWKETDNPKLENASFYSKIKYACDLAIGNLPNVCSLRIRMPISYKYEPRNLITKLLDFKRIHATANSMTFLSDIERAIDWAISNEKSGIYNLTSNEPLNHVQIVEEYRKYHPEHEYETIDLESALKLSIAPRSNCIIDSSKIQNDGFVIPPAQKLLESTMEQYVRERDASINN